jgi:hypothetical protein
MAQKSKPAGNVLMAPRRGVQLHRGTERGELRRGNDHGVAKRLELGIPLQRPYGPHPSRELGVRRIRTVGHEPACAHDEVLLVEDREVERRGDLRRSGPERLARALHVAAHLGLGDEQRRHCPERDEHRG